MQTVWKPTPSIRLGNGLVYRDGYIHQLSGPGDSASSGNRVRRATATQRQKYGSAGRGAGGGTKFINANDFKGPKPPDLDKGRGPMIQHPSVAKKPTTQPQPTQQPVPRSDHRLDPGWNVPRPPVSIAINTPGFLPSEIEALRPPPDTSGKIKREMNPEEKLFHNTVLEYIKDNPPPPDVREPMGPVYPLDKFPTAWEPAGPVVPMPTPPPPGPSASIRLGNNEVYRDGNIHQLNPAQQGDSASSGNIIRKASADQIAKYGSAGRGEGGGTRFVNAADFTKPPTAQETAQQAANNPAVPAPNVPGIAQLSAQRVHAPSLVPGAEFTATNIPFDSSQLINPTTGQLTSDVTVPSAAQVQATQTAAPTPVTAPQIAAIAAAPDVRDEAIQAAQTQAPTQTIEAQQQAVTNIANLQAAQQAQAVQVQPPATRTLQAGEVIDAPTGQATQAAAFIEPVAQAAVATPTTEATVQGQLATLQEQFEGGEIPPWARGAVRAATQTLAARGLGASSMAGQAILDAAIEQALPIAQFDARTVASFEAQNLSNRQQAAMTRAQYRAQFMQQEFDYTFQTRVRNAATVSDIANRNFTSDQQIALENARLIQTVDLQNLSNSQALVMAEAVALSQLDISNLNNRQQAAVQNAQNFLQLDTQNLNNRQQAAVINSQQQVQALLTDAAAENATRQFNAKNQQQADQFYDNLITSVSMNNTAQTNAMNQFNAGEVNALQRFNAEIVNQREQFNAKNQLAIEQSNAVWRREIATADTTALNFQNQFNAQNLLNISNVAYDNLWQEYRDVLELAFSAGESELDRISTLQIATLNNNSSRDLADFKADREDSRSIGGFIGSIFKDSLTGVVKGLF